MTTTTLAANLPSPRPSGRPSLLPTQAWAWIGVLGLLFIGLFGSFIWRMIRIATDQWGGDWSHALLIPFISLFYIYTRRHDLLARPRRVCWPGLALVFFGMLGYAWGLTPGPGPKDLLQGYSMILALFGLVLFLLGPAPMRVLWFPILFLVFAVKVSDRYWLNLAEKLQFIASRSAAGALNILGMNVKVEGATINIYEGMKVYGSLTVAEACSGLRMLAAFVAMGVAIAFFTRRAWWQRLVLVLATVPIAVFVNAARVTIMGLIYSPDNHLTEGDFHKFIGMLMLLPAMGLYLLLGWVMSWLAAEDEKPADPAAAPAAATPVVSTAEGPPPREVAAGVLLGVGLTALVALDYALLLSTLKPGFFGERFTPGMGAGLLVLGVMALAATAWGVMRFSKERTRDPRAATPPATPARTARPPGLPLGLSAGILAAAVLGLQGALWANGAVLHKEEVPLRRPLFAVPERFGSWQMTGDMKLSEEQMEVLRTTLYINRLYRDLDAPEGTPGSQVRFHLVYYTGTPDTVPHVPERCFIAGGAKFRQTFTTPMHVVGPAYLPPDPGAAGASAAGDSEASGGSGISGGSVGVRAMSQLAKGPVHVPAIDFGASVFTYAEPSNPNLQGNVIYFFAANGKFLATAADVRMKGFDLRDKYSYYCKVEIGVPGVADPEEAARRAEAFLSLAMPEIMACLPDWSEVLAGTWPPKAK